jgi:hypothetical protein
MTDIAEQVGQARAAFDRRFPEPDAGESDPVREARGAFNELVRELATISANIIQAAASGAKCCDSSND